MFVCPFEALLDGETMFVDPLGALTDGDTISVGEALTVG